MTSVLLHNQQVPSVFQARSIDIDDFTDGCPVSADTLGTIYRADAERLPSLVAEIPLQTRARLAAFLYGRSHTRDLGLQVAATCDAATMRRMSGDLGGTIYVQSRHSGARPTWGDDARSSGRRISLAGSQMASAHSV